ncbi:hypothetical protein HID58_078045 [Brassica napus]|uniref:Gnk2-homologous domain-containing protein n=1 Tax=Brassica napus TaxID=3708 RepID=A0ABQ7YS22_BRANA|nr:hypothetical protein HID58_078045 [Brassica napus]
MNPKSGNPNHVFSCLFHLHVSFLLPQWLQSFCSRSRLQKYHFCGNTTSYSANSTYFTNLKILLASLSSGNASCSTGFQNATVRQSPSRVTGLFLCRGDVSQETCSDCVSYSVKDILIKCVPLRERPLSTTIIVRSDTRTVIFSQTSQSMEHFCGVTITAREIATNITIGSNYEDQFEKLVLTTIIEAALEAANSSRYFCTRNAKGKEYVNLYVLVQFTPLDENLVMSSRASLIFLFFFSFLTSFRAYAQDPNYVYHNCPNTTTYTRNSTYSTNLRTLLSSLSSNNSSYSTGFQTATSGQGTDSVTGLFLCRGDVSPEVCRRCVRFVVNDTSNRCPNEREVVLYYDECIVRYSNRNILSTLSTNGALVASNGQNITSNQQAQFRDLVLSTMNQAASEAADSPRKFDARKANWTAPQSLYGLVQCTPDLTRQDCLSCLQQGINQLPTDKIGGQSLAPSCSSRYELYPFYNESAITTPQPPVSAPPPPGKGGSSSVLVVAIVVPIIVVALLFIACYCFLAKRAKKTFGTASAFDGDDITTAESLQLDYRTIQTATNDFAESNKIGQGGFGEVYKGTLSDGTEVAVKRLSKSSGQGDADGYMSPEYAMHGQYSMKSDVYSFGVLVLEIISGKKNSSFYQTDGAHDLVSYAWRLWSNGTPLDLVDPSIVDNFQRNEVFRCIHIGLLCVQEDPVERPPLSTIVLMLTSITMTLPIPRQPGLFFQSILGKDPLDSDKFTTTKSLLRVSAQDPTYVYHICPNTTTYTRNSTYSTNLRTLLSSLSSSNSSYSTGFQTATSGQGTDSVTGLFLCRGDVSPEVCRRCVAFVVNDTSTRCPNEREVVLYYDECIVRYSNRNILSTLNRNGGVILRNTQNITSNQNDQFRDLILSTMNQAASEAADSPRKFDARKADWTASQSLYGLVQCTPDLTRQDCLSCLQQGINQLPTDNIGGRFLVPSCSSRYELYAFYNESAITTPPPPPQPPVSVPPPPEKGGSSSVLVVAIVVPTIVVALLFIACYYFLAKRAKKTYGTSSAFDGDDITTAESLQLDYRSIQTATNDFSESNKIGQGGFGEVYKGALSDGTEVAVKRLSKSSGQGDADGYMSPEYAMHGQYSMKSDVYSFGVLVLEIISGKKNSSFYQTDGAHDLVSYAWRLWSNGTPLDLVDPIIVDNCQRNEVVRCVHIGLLCVQEDPVERPPLSTIVLMLTSNTVTLPVPRQPGLFFQSRLGKDPLDSDQFTTTKSLLRSVDDASITDVYPR